jgi:hypothetical protein
MHRPLIRIDMRTRFYSNLAAFRYLSLPCLKIPAQTPWTPFKHRNVENGVTSMPLPETINALLENEGNMLNPINLYQCHLIRRADATSNLLSMPELCDNAATKGYEDYTYGHRDKRGLFIFYLVLETLLSPPLLLQLIFLVQACFFFSTIFSQRTISCRVWVGRSIGSVCASVLSCSPPSTS